MRADNEKRRKYTPMPNVGASGKNIAIGRGTDLVHMY